MSFSIHEYFKGARSQAPLGEAHHEAMLPPKASLSAEKGFSPRSIHFRLAFPGLNG